MCFIFRFVAGNTSLAKMRFQECLNIRRSLFGEKNIVVGEIMEFLADLLFFLPEDSERQVFKKKDLKKLFICERERESERGREWNGEGQRERKRSQA